MVLSVKKMCPECGTRCQWVGGDQKIKNKNAKQASWTSQKHIWVLKSLAKAKLCQYTKTAVHHQKNDTPRPGWLLPNSAACLACVYYYSALWLSGRFTTLAHGGVVLLIMYCWLAYKETQGTGEEEKCSTWRADWSNVRRCVQVLIQPIVNVERISEWAEIKLHMHTQTHSDTKSSRIDTDDAK